MTSVFENHHLNLEYTLECGQTFRWKKLPDGFYYGVIGQTFTRIRQDGPRFSFETAPEPDQYPLIAAYFGLDRDEEYLSIIEKIRTDREINRAIDRYYGLRLLRQPSYETLISFILSANNNIPTVSRTVQAIGKKYGQPLVLGKYRSYTFPDAATLAQANDYELSVELGAEYRAKYIIESSRRISREGVDLDHLRDLPYDWALGQLTALPGVGRTVADSVLLFSLGVYEAFPLDTWVQRAMVTFYFAGAKTTAKEIHQFAANRWGPYAGYANEYLYMYARNNLGR